MTLNDNNTKNGNSRPIQNKSNEKKSKKYTVCGIPHTGEEGAVPGVG